MISFVVVVIFVCHFVVVVFLQAPFRVTNVPGHASAGIVLLSNCVGDFFTLFVLE